MSISRCGQPGLPSIAAGVELTDVSSMYVSEMNVGDPVGRTRSCSLA